jgi:RNA polymerase sigma factor (sigma-70 family)
MRLPTIYQDDAQLWQRLKSGEGEALVMIYDIHIDALYNYARRFTQNTALVEDCVQDLFAEIWEKREKLSETNSIKAYLFKSVRRKVLRALSKDDKYIHADEAFGQYVQEAEHSYERWLIDTQLTQEQQHKLKSCLEKLSARQKEAIVLKFYENLSNEEIGIIMDISIQSLYNLIHSAVKSLRQSYLTHTSPITTFSTFLFILIFCI